ncbi:apical ring associated protein 1, putative [Plasmodium chabaudi chabaudi]|uniref:Apical ring associated protein 1, putative n=2 Tax=Plasmodium chabaudi TaxID=5825 RepID=A0A1D3S2G4_PLACU|nr:apical ring associated protein 1, putative [Plasmodium chabaudi chabaudi]SCM13332.1 apical ring associated protein 1, putative [Plasmodium chabaudi adami]SCM24543.1 apical ring associated protein 1, putative [Plasmodium chabaudi adami]SCN62722.1 apical ring associated protein 1, putative [Plasmodium chabaudi chabaudi]VTZ70805.1 apical ring associated protein 1, putative [Plasmodium chabaudi chabaudi]
MSILYAPSSSIIYKECISVPVVSTPAVYTIYTAPTPTIIATPIQPRFPVVFISNPIGGKTIII